MNRREAIAECDRWLAYLDRQKEKTAAMQQLIAAPQLPAENWMGLARRILEEVQLRQRDRWREDREIEQ